MLLVPLALSVATTLTVAPIEVVPLTETLVSVSELIGFGETDVMAIDGASRSLVVVAVVVATLPAASVAVAVNVIVPSAKPVVSMPAAVQLPDESTVAL